MALTNTKGRGDAIIVILCIDVDKPGVMDNEEAAAAVEEDALLYGVVCERLEADAGKASSFVASVVVVVVVVDDSFEDSSTALELVVSIAAARPSAVGKEEEKGIMLSRPAISSNRCVSCSTARPSC